MGKGKRSRAQMHTIGPDCSGCDGSKNSRAADSGRAVLMGSTGQDSQQSRTKAGLSVGSTLDRVGPPISCPNLRCFYCRSGCALKRILSVPTECFEASRAIQERGRTKRTSGRICCLLYPPRRTKLLPSAQMWKSQSLVAVESVEDKDRQGCFGLWMCPPFEAPSAAWPGKPRHGQEKRSAAARQGGLVRGSRHSCSFTRPIASMLPSTLEYTYRLTYYSSDQ
ncbi:hypothetical protein F4808DRAFT_63525 [Astrocystis sublimbata]|nr:hypothetical protein F4808DRAFT_63525 [Astrocystis sublimbata]